MLENSTFRTRFCRTFYFANAKIYNSLKIFMLENCVYQNYNTKQIERIFKLFKNYKCCLIK